MSIKSDRWIKRMAAEGMIEPFESEQVRSGSEGRIISYGTSSYGYDVRCADEFKVFTNIHQQRLTQSTLSFVDIQSDVCVIPPNFFAPARTVNILGFRARC